MEQEKKTWLTPELSQYGNVEAITMTPKLKDVGAGDDFASNISNV